MSECFGVEQWSAVTRVSAMSCEARDTLSQRLARLAEHETHEIDALEPCERTRRHERAVAQDGDAIAHRIQLVEAVADVDDGRPLRLEAANEVMQDRHLALGQGARRLVEHEDPGAERHATRDGDHLLSRSVQGAECRFGIDVETEAREQRLRLGVHSRPVDESPPTRFAAEEHVLGHRAQSQEMNLLMHRAHASGLRLGRRFEVDRSVAEKHRAVIAMVRAGHDLHERGLAGAILTDERVDFAGC